MPTPTRLATYAFALLAFLALPACATEEEAPEVIEEQPMEPVAANDIVSTATENGMTTLVTAVQTAGLTETLQGEGPFTVFAPTNEAFDALPEGALDGLLAEEGHSELSRILTYHVVPGRIESSTLAGTMTFDTVEGGTLTVTAGDDGVTVTDAAGNAVNVVTADVNVSNGVVHVIDGVLMPGEAADSADAM
ncbi:MAG: fasciclin domain-containing protein [Rhodothermaceae bacterium]|nr:fasciclin domain-containing protein [Rhodothermaceae bacterium]